MCTDHVTHAVAVIFQSGGNRETFAMLEEAENLTALRGHACGIDQAERAPGVDGRARLGLQIHRLLALVFDLDCGGASARHNTLQRLEDETSMSIFIGRHRHGIQHEPGEDQALAIDETDEVGNSSGLAVHRRRRRRGELAGDLEQVLVAELVQGQIIHSPPYVQQLAQGLGGEENLGALGNGLA